MDVILKGEFVITAFFFTLVLNLTMILNFFVIVYIGKFLYFSMAFCSHQPTYPVGKT